MYYHLKIINNQPINDDIKIHENIRKIATGQGDDYITGCLLYCPYFKNKSKMIAIDLSKQQALEDDARAIQQINFTGKLDATEREFNVFHYWKSKGNYFGLFKRNCKDIVNVLYNNWIWLNIKNDWIK